VADCTYEDAATALDALPIPWVGAGGHLQRVVFLAADEARYFTGATFPVDAGFTVKQGNTYRPGSATRA
jgi:(+)-trans-carveol dehydrogenase